MGDTAPFALPYDRDGHRASAGHRLEQDQRSRLADTRQTEGIAGLENVVGVAA